MKKVNVHEPEAALYLVYSYQKAEFHQALEKAILSAYKKESPKSPIKVLDTEKAIRLIKQVLKKFSATNKKRGPKPEKRVEKANMYFHDELQKAKLTIVEYRQKDAKYRRAFWDKNIWQPYEREIIDDETFFDGTKKSNRGKSALLFEKDRIEDRVRRWNLKKLPRPMKRREEKRIISKKK